MTTGNIGTHIRDIYGIAVQDLKELISELKAIYVTVDETSALDASDDFTEKQDRKYLQISDLWRDNWANLGIYFKYPKELRNLIYITNVIEGFNRQLCKVTKAKFVFPTDDCLLKTMYPAAMDITRKWTDRRRGGGRIYANPAVYFEDRIPR